MSEILNNVSNFSNFWLLRVLVSWFLLIFLVSVFQYVYAWLTDAENPFPPNKIIELTMIYIFRYKIEEYNNTRWYIRDGGSTVSDGDIGVCLPPTILTIIVLFLYIISKIGLIILGIVGLIVWMFAMRQIIRYFKRRKLVDIK